MDRLENILINIDLEKGYERLTKRERNIVSLYYLEGYKDEEIAKLYGICRQSVNESRQKGIKKLKYFLSTTLRNHLFFAMYK
jgi:RNA polymerase sigma factor for flagellar operon FliA